MMMKYLLLAAGVTVLAGCSEIYEPDIETVEPFIVVEGSITTKPGYSYVYLSKSRSYNESPYFEGVAGATVWVSDDDGNSLVYEPVNLGVYALFQEEGNIASVGNTYTLTIITTDGDTLQSTPQEITQCPEIRSIFCEYDQKSILSEDSYGDVLEITYDGININMETDGLLSSGNFYIYNWLGYEEHAANIQYQPEGGAPSTFDIYRHRKLNGKYTSVIHTANADLYNEYRLRDEKLVFIAQEDMTNYTPIYPDSFTLINNRFDGLLFRLQQLSISGDAYKFYNDIEKQLAAEGHLFDPISPQIIGNISCTNDETVKVIGIFSASDVTEKYSYLYMNQSNRTYSMDIDSFPELWLDTCSWGTPEGWIFPPF
jgi:hypothetical protein